MKIPLLARRGWTEKSSLPPNIVKKQIYRKHDIINFKPIYFITISGLKSCNHQRILYKREYVRAC